MSTLITLPRWARLLPNVPGRIDREASTVSQAADQGRHSRSRRRYRAWRRVFYQPRPAKCTCRHQGERVKSVIEMAREAGFATSWTEAAGEALERFAELVRAEAQPAQPAQPLSDEVVEAAIRRAFASTNESGSTSLLKHWYGKGFRDCAADNNAGADWDGLTDDERTHSASPELWMYLTEKQKQDFIVYARDIEAKLKERNT